MISFKRRITYAEPLFYIIIILLTAVFFGALTVRSFYINYSYATKAVSTKAVVTKIHSSPSGPRGGGSMYVTVRFNDQNGKEINTVVQRRFGPNTVEMELFSEQVVWYDPSHPNMVGWKEGSVSRAYSRAIFPSIIVLALITLGIHLHRKFYHELEKDHYKKSSR